MQRWRTSSAQTLLCEAKTRVGLEGRDSYHNITEGMNKFAFFCILHVIIHNKAFFCSSGLANYKNKAKVIDAQI